ncbi:hypothetical protein GCM10023115_14700 [Pontixanthobacter gangjinensis]|uniref:hypothetical protein n=1 Tax=Pontixanthobacter gangjinensis TaxID=1028742 RepID=UPI0019277D67|nr:hypothetical protein [Pontixanthobacter gangjinensis]
MGTVGSTAQGHVAEAINLDGQSLVLDVRQLNIAAGACRIEFPDVSTQLFAETHSFAAADTAIDEQSFDCDLLAPTPLMAKAIGQTVTLLRTSRAETRERAMCFRP